MNIEIKLFSNEFKVPEELVEIWNLVLNEVVLLMEFLGALNVHTEKSGGFSICAVTLCKTASVHRLYYGLCSTLWYSLVL